MGKIHRDILENWNADRWGNAGYNSQGVMLFTLYRDNKAITTDSLLGLSSRGYD